MKLSDMLKTRDRLRAEAGKIIKVAEDANRAPEENEQTRLDEIRTEAEALETRIRNQAFIDELERQQQGTPLNGNDELAREKRQFRLTRLIASTFDPSVDAAREREICAEQVKLTGRSSDGFLIPFDCLVPAPRMERRVLTVAGDASNLVSTTVMGDEFIDALRPQAVATRLGARVITGLVGDISLPRRDARTPAAGWFVENNPIGSGDQSFDAVPGTPRHLGLITEFGRKTMLQSTPGIEQLTREHLMAELGVGIDLGVLKGSGAGGQPTGITQTGGIGTKDSASAAPSWADVREVVAMVEGADVPGDGLGWAFNAFVRSKFATTTKVTNDAGAGFLEDADGRVAGAPVGVTSQLLGDPAASPVVDGEAIFGRWPEVILAMWSGVEILVNPYESTAYARGNVSVRGIVDADVLVRHPVAFVHWSNIKVD